MQWAEMYENLNGKNTLKDNPANTEFDAMTCLCIQLY